MRKTSLLCLNVPEREKFKEYREGKTMHCD